MKFRVVESFPFTGYGVIDGEVSSMVRVVAIDGARCKE